MEDWSELGLVECSETDVYGKVSPNPQVVYVPRGLSPSSGKSNLDVVCSVRGRRGLDRVGGFSQTIVYPKMYKILGIKFFNFCSFSLKVLYT